MSTRLVILQVAIFGFEDGSQSKKSESVNRTLFYDATVCALSTGTHASRCRIGTDWYALFLCCLSRLVLSVESKRMKASLAVIASAANVG